MQEINPQEIFLKIYEFLQEKNLLHTAFVLKHEARLEKEKSQEGSSLMAIYMKGKEYENIELGKIMEMEREMVDGNGWNNQEEPIVRYIDQRIEQGLGELQQKGFIDWTQRSAEQKKPLIFERN